MVKQKKIVILGGIPQLIDIVNDAKQKGLHVILLDNLSDSPAKKFADESYLISITDVDSIVSLCRNEKVDGVMNYCIDPGQIPYQKICSKLGFYCYGTLKQFNIMTNKKLFYQVCKENNVGVVERYKIDANNYSSYNDLNYPIVVKPADGRASKGITFCRDKNDLKEAIEKAKKNSLSQSVIYEKYMEKPEICVKYFVVDGKIFLTSMADLHSHYINGDRAYFSGQSFPSVYYTEFLKDTDLKLRKMIRNIGVKNGPLSFSGFYDDGEFKFIDPSFRLGGAQDWLIVEKTSGINIADCMTNFAIHGTMGNVNKIKVIDNSFSKKYSKIVYFLVKPGTINKIIGLKKVLSLKAVIGHHINHPEGSTVVSYGTSDHVVMRILISVEDKSTLNKVYKTITDSIKILDNNKENMIINH